eukprot:6175340-Pleurochrysis_carterae.AAC.2
MKTSTVTGAANAIADQYSFNTRFEKLMKAGEDQALHNAKFDAMCAPRARATQGDGCAESRSGCTWRGPLKKKVGS